MDLDQPERWSLKGEGNANWVFAYAGTMPHLVGHVLRVRKPKPAAAPAELELEEAVWASVLGRAADGSSPAQAAAEREQAYIQTVLAPLLGPQLIPAQHFVQPGPTFLARLLQHACDCPADSAAVEAALQLPAALMPDATLLLGRGGGDGSSGPTPAAGPASLQGPAVCVELKPKCGVVAAACPTQHPDHREVKRSASRYQLHQLLKLEQGKIAARSAYDPCDLFSGDALRLRAALAALLQQPQNNLLLFREGRRRQLAAGRRAAPRAAAGQLQERGGGQGTSQQQQQQQGQGQGGGEAALEGLLEGLLPLPPSQRRTALVELLAAVLELEGVLGRLLAAQQQCRYDIEGVYRLYLHLTGDGTAAAPAHADGSGGAGEQGSDAAAPPYDEHAAAVQRLLRLPTEDAYAVLRSYVVATTAKDLALMITLQRLAGAAEPPQQRRQGGGGGPPLGRVYCAAAGGWYAYRLTLVDLDLKPLAKVPQHHRLDREIVAAARRRCADGLGGGGSAADEQQQHAVTQPQH